MAEEKKTAKKPTAKVKVAVKAAEAAAAAEVKEEEIKKEAVKKAETAKKTAKKAAAEVRKTAEKTTEEVKKVAEKTTEEVKKTVRKAAAKKAAPSATVSVQFAGKSYTTEDLIKSAQDVWHYDMNREVSEIKTIELYVKPEESVAYFVINGVAGSFRI